MANEIDDSVLQWLEDVSLAADPPPWRSMVEGRDHVAGDSFIMVGRADDRAEDIYVSRDSGPAKASDLDAIAAARTYLPLLVAEIRRLRRSTE
jgi:hypothetical protein